MKTGRFLSVLAVAASVLGTALCVLTAAQVLDPPSTLDLSRDGGNKFQVLDRRGRPLNITYHNEWNLHDQVPLHEVPDLLQAAFVAAEDKRYFDHRGVDWFARLHAAVQNAAALRAKRGASTITEQVVRLLRPRPRTIWSRWIEGFEAVRLEKRFSKADILEFYLNQVPYAARRRGVTQAARYYFDRELDTLSVRETLALAVLVRAPGRMDLRRDPEAVDGPLRRLAERLVEEKVLSDLEQRVAREEPWRLREPALPVEASHFVRHVLAEGDHAEEESLHLRTTLDGRLQNTVQALLDQRLRELRRLGVRHGGALVVDNQSNEVLAWCAAGEGTWYNTVLIARQPGSTLKPFVYALALEKGWTAATPIEDFPLEEAVGTGLHTYRNYSRTYYGEVSLREALGNSLNTPAVRAARFVGSGLFHARLRLLGFESLKGHPDLYGDGLVLGNGEVSLFELVRAYSVLAGDGRFRPLVLLGGEGGSPPGKPVFSPEVASLVGNILSDPEARQLEFGRGGLLHFPVQTAVKTGTSSDYRDAWAVGFNFRFTVGVWMGNLEGAAMDGVTGSLGPGLVLRGIFHELTKDLRTRPLYLSPLLERREICREDGGPADGTCPSTTEWFLPGTGPPESRPPRVKTDVALLKPADGMRLALDPRIPDEFEAFEFAVSRPSEGGRVEWILDGEVVAATDGPTYLWPLRRGEHVLSARLNGSPDELPADTRERCLSPIWRETMSRKDRKIPAKKLQVQKGMVTVCYALVPCLFFSVYLFGWRSVAVVAVTLLFGVGTEALFNFRKGKPVTSAVFVTATILALSLPPTIPLWMCALGAVVGVGLGKMAFGGMGKNIFNPAMVGRCFLYVSFPLHMTNRWVEPFIGGAGGFGCWAAPLDGVTGATPLALLQGGGGIVVADLFFGFTGGSLGETSALLIILAGAWLIYRKVAPWRIALSCLVGGIAVSALLLLFGDPGLPSPFETLLAGSFLFGAAFVATEPVSGARTKEGQWVYGFAIGALTVLLRLFSNFPDGIMFSVLLMNAFAPLLDLGVRSLKRRQSVPVKVAT
jgi:penicillin-binding protein 1C